MAHSTATIALWLERILGHEGGLSLDPKDPGNWTLGRSGAGDLRGTKWGIAANTYPTLDIQNLTVVRAAEIYRDDFIDPLGLDRFDDGVAFQLLDFAVNSGIQTAIRRMQRALGVADDGKVGPITQAAITSRSESDVIMLVLAERLDFMSSLSSWPVHGKGWARRIAQNLRYGAIDT